MNPEFGRILKNRNWNICIEEDFLTTNKKKNTFNKLIRSLSIASNYSNSNSQFYWSFPKIRMGLGFYFCFFLKGYTRRLKDDTYWLLSQDHSSSFIELQACIFNHTLSARMNLLWAPDYKLHQCGENKILVGDLISSEVWLETV